MMTSGMEWIYDEMRQIGTDYASVEEVERYDRRMASIRDVKAENEEILNLLEPKGEGVLLELGSGTGELVLSASERYREVVAADVSTVMLEYARQKAGKRERKNIRFIQSGFLNCPEPEDHFDAVVSQLALHHLPDFWKMVALKKVFGLLTGGGRFFLRDVVFSLQLEKYEKTVQYALEQMTESGGEAMGQSFARHIRSEYSTYDWIMEEMLYRAGFDIELADYREHFIAVYLCRKGKGRA